MSLEDELHAIICQAVALLNVTPELARSDTGRHAHEILRKALIAYADRAALAESAKAEAQADAEPAICHKCQGLGKRYMGCDEWIHCETCNATGKLHPPRRELSDEDIARHSLKARECLSDSDVILVSSLKRLIARRDSTGGKNE
jgi:hypothetical protein